MGYEVLYATALEVRPERLEDVRRILKLRDEAIRKERTREGFAELLRRELPHLAEAFTPDGVGAFLNSFEPSLSGDGFLDLGSVYNGGTEGEALLLSHLLAEGEVIVVSDAEGFPWGYRVLGPGKVEPLYPALANAQGEVVWDERPRGSAQAPGGEEER